jgi:hypothetical protein
VSKALEKSVYTTSVQLQVFIETIQSLIHSNKLVAVEWFEMKALLMFIDDALFKRGNELIFGVNETSHYLAHCSGCDVYWTVICRISSIAFLEDGGNKRFSHTSGSILLSKLYEK